jgi:hypothetical protein
MPPRLLSEAEFQATFSERMLDIKGREPELHPEGVIDLEPYLGAISRSDFGALRLLSGAPPTSVYRSEDGRFDHILYPCDRPNVFLVVVVALRPDRVQGHYILDLNKEYGLDGAAV